MIMNNGDAYLPKYVGNDKLFVMTENQFAA